jgi:tetratricopeptide (TPR) repeat protein
MKSIHLCMFVLAACTTRATVQPSPSTPEGAERRPAIHPDPSEAAGAAASALADQLLQQGRVPEALVELRKAYAIAKQRLPGTITAGITAAKLAEALADNDDCESGLAFYSESIEILDHVLPHSDPNLSLLMNRKVSCLSRLQRDEDARHLLHSIFERAREEHYQVPVTIVASAHDMARACAASGDLISAALVFEDTVAVIRSMSGAGGSEHLWQALSDVAGLYEQADVPTSELATLQEMTKLTPPDPDRRCDLVVRLTSADLRAGHPFEAQETLQEAERCLDGRQPAWLSWVSFQFSRLQHPGLAQKVVDRALSDPRLSKADTASLLSSMAIAHLTSLDPCQAARVARRALSLLDKTVSNEQVEHVRSVRDTASRSCHDSAPTKRSSTVRASDPAALARAQEELREAERTYAADSQSVLGRRFNLGIELQRSGRPADSCRELTAVAMRFTAKVLPLITEVSRASQIAVQQGFTTHLIDALVTSCLPVSAAALAEPLLYVKGHVMEGVRQESELLRLEVTPEHRESVLRLRRVRSRIAGALLATARGQRDVADLTDEKEQLERRLNASKDSTTIEPLGLIGGLTGLRRSMNDDEVYIDLTSYSAAGGSSMDRRLVALVISRGSVAVVDLRLEPILALRDAWLADIASWDSPGKASASRLRKALIEPVLAVVPSGVHDVIVSPDECLHGTPWQIPDFVTAGATVWLVPTARELVRWKIASDGARSTSSRISIIDRADFDAGPGRLMSEPERLLPLSDALPDALVPFKATTATVVRGSGATLENLAQELGTAEMLHIQSHGVFTGIADKLKIWSRNPFSSSALALASANRKDDTGKRLGLVTAEQLVGLAGPNLRVATLAMCDGGRGAGIPGQGNLGFVTALSAMGTPNVIASAWRASLESANALFPLFYEGLFSGRAARDAFDRAVAAIRARRGLRGARHWAAWQYFGYDRPSSAPTLELSRLAHRLCACRSAECWKDPRDLERLRSVLSTPGLTDEDQHTILDLVAGLKQCRSAAPDQ